MKTLATLIPGAALAASLCTMSPVCHAQGLIPGFTAGNTHNERALEEQFLQLPLPSMCETFLYNLVKAPHHAGSIGDRRTAEYLDSLYRSFGFESRIAEYWAYLPYPTEVVISVLTPEFAQLKIAEDSLQQGGLIPFNAYSPSGDVTSDLVYVNRGLENDYRKLTELGIDVRGKILLARYGGGYRGGKVFLAERHGAIGLILFSDPADDGYVTGDIYPRGPMRPWDAVERGSISYSSEFIGDPLTPGNVPTKDAMRLDPATSARLPKIPTTPISYRDALTLMKHMEGPVVPREWQGGLPLTYHIGPGMTRVRLKLQFDFQVRPVWDNIAVIKGHEDPEKKIIIGNHRDAWVNGAVDPNSATAALTETARCLGEMKKKGWQPKRTIIFANWDAEEYGITGSTAWGEENREDLFENAIVYLNFDASITGSKLHASAVPSLDRFLRDLAADIPGPTTGFAEPKPETVPLPRERPQLANIGRMGGGSDFAVFLDNIGVPCAEWGLGGPYGVYHSAYDNFAWMKKFGDPQFSSHLIMAKMIGVAAMRLADSDILPFHFDDYAAEITTYIESLRKNLAVLKDSSLDLSILAALAREWQKESAQLNDDVDSALTHNRSSHRINLLLASMERQFISSDGLPHRPWFRHLIYAPGSITGYTTQTLPGISDQLDDSQPDLSVAERRKTASTQLDLLTTAMKKALAVTRMAQETLK